MKALTVPLAPPAPAGTGEPPAVATAEGGGVSIHLGLNSDTVAFITKGFAVALSTGAGLTSGAAAAATVFVAAAAVALAVALAVVVAVAAGMVSTIGAVVDTTGAVVAAVAAAVLATGVDAITGDVLLASLMLYYFLSRSLSCV